LPRNALVPEQSPGPEEVWPAGKLMMRVKSPAPIQCYTLAAAHPSQPTEVRSLLPGLEK